MSAAHNFEASASETTPQRDHREPLLDNGTGGISRLVSSSQIMSPLLEYPHSPGEMDDSGEIKGRFENPLHDIDQGNDEEDLYAEIDPGPAEGEMNKIIHLLAYLRNDGMRPTVVSEYQHIPAFNLQKHLEDEAWEAATGGPLAEILGELLDRNEKLRTKCQQLKEEHTHLEQECSRLMTEDRQNIVKTLAEALGVTPIPGVAGLHELKREIMELRKANISLETERLTLTRKNALLANENAALAKQILTSIQKIQIPSEEK